MIHYSSFGNKELRDLTQIKSMPSFSERYGYVQPSDIIIREEMPEEVSNAICNTLDLLEKELDSQAHVVRYEDVELELWCHFLNQKRSDFYNEYGHCRIVATHYIDNTRNPWHMRLDMLEFIIQYLLCHLTGYSDN